MKCVFRLRNVLLFAAVYRRGFFIPYDKMEDLPDKVKFLILGGILFISDLPEVPSRIRFHGRNTKETLAFVNEQRRKFLMR